VCGIIGYIGPRDCVEVLLDGLRRLEYRGYDSAGVAVLAADSLRMLKRAGKLSVLRTATETDPSVHGLSIGIAHTRWATHGPPSEKNAHPHPDCTGRIAVVHNGIIENYLSLRQELTADGHTFRSDTDTEVIPHLIESYYNGDLLDALRKALRRLEGSYATAVLCADEPGRLVVARQYSPLIVGLGEGENFVASDIPAILPYTRRAYLLDNGEVGSISRDGIIIETAEGKTVSKAVFEVKWDAEAAEKGGYKHFMLKEIFEQPQGLRETLAGRLTPDNLVRLDDLAISDEELRKLNRAIIIACGTAAYAGMVGQQTIERLAGIPVVVDVASEAQLREALFDERTLGIVISQSGETADTLQAQRMARRRGAKTVGITNVIGSSVARESDGLIYIYAGPEIGVASTKAYTCQITALYLLAVHLGLVRGALSTDAARTLARQIRALPELAEDTLEQAPHVKDLAEKYAGVRRYLYLGRGFNYASAMEGALKIKEIAYLDAEGYAAGEMKHGPLALVEPGVNIVATVVPGQVYHKMLGNLQEIKARAGTIICIAAEGDEEISAYADDVITIPRTDEMLSPVLAAIPLQLYAYYIADLLGCEIDQPRNLAKSVTVE